MRIVLSADMEGISGMRDIRELLACRAEYWETGRARMTDDVLAAAHGLLDGGAKEVIVLDNHASGCAANLDAGRFPSGVRFSDENVFDLPAVEIDGMLQVGYHPRRGVAGFAPHTYVPGLRLWVDDEEISESHGRAWAAQAPLLGITGHRSHGSSLGSLDGVPFLPVQEGVDAHAAEPTLPHPSEAATAIRSFASRVVSDIAEAARPDAPRDALFCAELERPGERQVQLMLAGRWDRESDHRFFTVLPSWTHARKPLATAMRAALEPFAAPLAALDLSSREAMVRADPDACDRVTNLFLGSIR